MRGAYAVAVVLIGLVAGLNRNVPQWFVAAGILALAIGMTASALLRVEIVFGDREMRRRLWWSAGRLTRFWRAVSLVMRVGLAVVMWTIALGLVRR
jgi:putative flippase GtrA